MVATSDKQTDQTKAGLVMSEDGERISSKIAVHLYIAYSCVAKAIEEINGARLSSSQLQLIHDLLDAEAHLITARERISRWTAGGGQ